MFETNKGDIVSLRAKTIQTRKSGAAERRNWNPSEDDAHYRIYAWWMDRTGNRPSRENFCHYWRVVLIWAPLRWLLVPIAYTLVAALTGVILWVAISFTDVFFGIVITLAGLAYLVGGTMVGIRLLHTLAIRALSTKTAPWFDDLSSTLKSLLVLVFLPVVAAEAALLLLFGSLISIILGLHDDYDIYARSWRWLVSTKLSERRGLSWIRPWSAVAIGALVVTSALSFEYTFARSILIGLAMSCMFAGAVVGSFSGLAWMSFTLKERRNKQATLRQQHETIEVLLTAIFKEIHPDQQGDLERYTAWRHRYELYMNWYTHKPFHTIEWHEHLDRLKPSVRRRVEFRVYHLNYQAPPVHIRQLSRFTMWIRAALRNTGNILAFAWTVVLTKKWKICPWVELPASS